MSNTNDFDTPPDDLDPNVDQDMDFGEFEDTKQKSLGSAMKNNPLIKFGLVGAAVLVIIIVVTLFGGDSEKAKNSLVSRGDPNFKEAPGTKVVTPVMQQAMEEKNQQRIEEAQKQGGSAIPTPIEAPKTLLDVPDDQGAGEDPLLRWKQMQEERAKAQREQQMTEAQNTPQADPQRDAKIQQMATGMSAQVSKILGKDKKSELQHMVVYDVSKIKSKSSSASRAQGVRGDVLDSTMPEAKPAKVLLAAGKVEYAQMVLEANSDIPGPVVAMIVSGPFNGSRLMGTFQAQEDYLVIRFSTLVTKKGTSVPINAFAVDPDTSLTGVATDVDHRYFARIVLPAAAKFVEGLGDAYSQTTTSTTQNSTTTTTSSEDLNTKQEFGKAVSEAAKKVGDVLDDEGQNTKPLVRVRAGTPLGVLFMSPVTDQNILQARAGVVPQQEQVPQQGQQQPVQMYQGNNMNALQQLQMGLQNQQFMQQQGTYSGAPAYNQTGTTGTANQ